ncbi:Eco29kI family restriction endonuclease [Streptomyces sp. IB2014 016-6]|uniref:Eco29kI family restriction endonuclease n=1 Tax=Streptomyces sp. IB2014 016-6 TaxID=2517818 RepID=UPI0011CB7E91|nr:Eco29kI family restriction endonuclease [Streptomyces sp. IB2014 016-6]TXL84601.1 Eco29kI family restriction endonuclease [Streptomyces sp. IB2014 016-6]
MSKPAETDASATNHDDFRLSITQALGDQLAAALDKLTPAPLTEANLNRLGDRAGVYQLYRNGEFVYVGKADKSLPTRILKHLRKVSGRQGISLAEMTFTCLYVAEDFSALAPEKLLIKHYKEQGQIRWNNNGFGNNDPGKRRDETVVKANHFDALFRIDLERVISGFKPGTMALSKVLARVSAEAPYTFRYEKKKTGAAYKREVEIPDHELTIAQMLGLIARSLPTEWQIAVLPGRVIMYPDNRRDYPSVWRYYRGEQILDVEPEIGEVGEIPEEPDAVEDDD